VAVEQDPHLVAVLSDGDVWMAFFRVSEVNLLALLAKVSHAT
jgi:hypothetical protein